MITKYDLTIPFTGHPTYRGERKQNCDLNLIYYFKHVDDFLLEFKRVTVTLAQNTPSSVIQR